MKLEFLADEKHALFVGLRNGEVGK
jgi:hypothetical protein